MLPSNWKTLRLSEIVDIMPGYAFKSEAFTDNPDDVALVKGENVHQGFIDWQAAKRWPSNESDVLAKYKLVEGDVVLAMDRPWVTAGLKWAYIRKGNPDSLLVQRVARLRAKKGIDQTFLRCLVSSPYFSGYIQPIVTGVNVPHISAKQIGDCLVNCPPLETQRKIAGILSAYDDLIENNRRRIAILERMAEELYREWFVRMRFPGYQNTKFVKGVPAGWEVRSLGSIYDTTSGGTPSRTESGYYTGEIPWVKTGELNNRFIHSTEESITEVALESSSAKLFPAGTVIIALYGATIGELAILGCAAATNQACAALFPKDPRYHYSYTIQLMRSIKSGLVAIAFGGAQQNID